MTKGKHYISIPSLLKPANQKILSDAVPGIGRTLYLAADMESASLKNSLKWQMIVTTTAPEKKPVSPEKHIIYFNPLLD